MQQHVSKANNECGMRIQNCYFDYLTRYSNHRAILILILTIDVVAKGQYLVNERCCCVSKSIGTPNKSIKIVNTFHTRVPSLFLQHKLKYKTRYFRKT